MEIKASSVKALRDKTGAGMMDCRNALEKAGGDSNRAEKILKELGLAAAAKRSSRVTGEGKVFSRIEGDRGVLLELLCETDFVARNSEFQALGDALTRIVLDKNLTEKTEELEGLVTDAIGRIKENMSLGRIVTMEAGPQEYLVSYVHADKIGVLVKLSAGDRGVLENEKLREAAFDLALHAAAFAPMYLTPADVDSAYLKEQEELFTIQAKNLGKPDGVVQGIVKGKLKKHLQEICFMNQMHVKQTKSSVADVLRELGKELGTEVKLTGYRYFKLGVQ